MLSKLLLCVVSSLPLIANANEIDNSKGIELSYNIIEQTIEEIVELSMNNESQSEDLYSFWFSGEDEQQSLSLFENTEESSEESIELFACEECRPESLFTYFANDEEVFLSVIENVDEQEFFASHEEKAEMHASNEENSSVMCC